MGRRVSSSRSRGISGRGFKASGFKSSGFKSSGSRSFGGYNHRYRPYRRNYFFDSLSPRGKLIYICFLIILFVVVSFL